MVIHMNCTDKKLLFYDTDRKAVYVCCRKDANCYGKTPVCEECGCKEGIEGKGRGEGLTAGREPQP